MNETAQHKRECKHSYNCWYGEVDAIIRHGLLLLPRHHHHRVMDHLKTCDETAHVKLLYLDDISIPTINYQHIICTVWYSKERYIACGASINYQCIICTVRYSKVQYIACSVKSTISV